MRYSNENELCCQEENLVIENLSEIQSLLDRYTDDETRQIRVFRSKSPQFAHNENTSFKTVPTVLNSKNILKVLQNDLTGILFKDGYCNSENFNECHCFIVDVDHGLTLEQAHEILKGLHINHLIVSSRNHQLHKEPKGNDDGSPCDRFHALLPVTTPLTKERYIKSGYWAQKVLNADPQALTLAQKSYGYGNNPNPVIRLFLSEMNFDEMVKDVELDTIEKEFKEKEKQANRKVKPSGNKTYDHFENWESHLHVFVEKGWRYEYKNNKLYLWTPDGSTKQDGNIRLDDGCMFLFKSSGGFKSHKPYRPVDFYCILLYGDNTRESKLKLAEQYEGVTLGTTYREGDYIPDIGKWHLSKKNPLVNARALVNKYLSFDDEIYIKYYCGEYYFWENNKYSAIDPDDLFAETQAFMVDEGVELVFDNGEFRYVPYSASSFLVDETTKSFKSVAGVRVTKDQAPTKWLAGFPAPCSFEDVIFCKTINYNWKTNEFIPVTSYWFNTSTISCDIDFETKTEPTRYIQWLNEMYGDIDQESINLLEEYSGLTLTNYQRFHKILLWVGVKRSGKGTHSRLLQHFHGKDNVSAPQTSSLSDGFVLSAFMDKSLVVFDDVRITAADVKKVNELLLKIVANDGVLINRKYLKPLTCYLTSHFILMSNEVPQLADSTDVVHSRCLALETKQSFFDREDHSLIDKLIAEAPAILKRWILALQRLLKRDGFVQPKSSRHILQNMRELGNPAILFLEECCILDTDEKISSNILYQAFRDWMEANGYDLKGKNSAQFGKMLKAIAPSVTKDHKKPVYYGIQLKVSRLNDGTATRFVEN